MKKNITLYVKSFSLVVIGILLLSINGYTQYTISGSTCVLPGNYPFTPYQINGNLGPNTGAGDKWCITNGTINGSSACYTNPGNPYCGSVAWSSSASTGTLSYYRPASSTTPVATITVTIVSPGTVGPSYLAIPVNTPVTVTCTGTDVVIPCGSGPVSYQWMTQINGVYANIPGATGRDYVLTGTFTQSFNLWRQVFWNGFSSLNMNGPVFIDPKTPHNPGTIGPVSQGVTTSQMPQAIGPLTNPSGGTYGPNYNFYWQSSTDNITWQDMPGLSNSGTAATPLQPGLLTQTTYYRIRVGNGPLAYGVYTNVATVIVYSPLLSGTISPAELVIPYNTSPGALTGTPATRGFCTGNYQYQWEQSLNGTDFTAIAGATGQNYTPGNLTVTTYYRRQATLSCNTEVAYSNIIAIKVSNPTDNANYIRERIFKKPGINEVNVADYLSDLRETVQSTQYFDGLGRNIQTVIRKGAFATDVVNPSSSANATDLVSFKEYDNMGREQTRYLGYAANDNLGTFKTDAITAQSTFMQNQYATQNESDFYGKTFYENAPAGRVTNVQAAGVNWAGSNRGTERGYFVNSLPDDVQRWDVVNSGTYGVFASYTHMGTYTPGTLTKNIVKDENGHQVIEFRDKEDKVILRKVQVTATADPGTGSGHSNWLCTYFIYDDLNNLRCVIQPKGVELIAPGWQLTDPDILAEQCFRYEYDSRGRMIMKKTPGAGETYMVFDNRDRLVMTQDANMRAGAPVKWLVLLYDNNNRAIEKGLWDNTQSLATHIAGATATSVTNYPFAPGATPGSGYEFILKTGYDNYNGLPASGNLNSSFNTSWASLFSTTYNTAPDFAQEQVATNETQGLETWTQVKLLNVTPARYIYTVNIYDSRGRIIQVKSRNNTGGEDVATTQYSFTGQPLLIVHKQEKAGTPAQTNVVVTQNTYDDLGRLIRIDKKAGNTAINNGALPPAWKTIAVNKYDALGQLVSKSLGSVETLNYEYNVRGWLLGINRAYVKGQSAAKFGFELAYDKNDNIIAGQTYNTARQYNGNLMGTTWASMGDNEKRKYDFSYDGANRLLKADFTQLTGGTFNKSAGVDFTTQVGDGQTPSLAYDANGNIISMKQWGLTLGTSPVIDDFTYAYKKGNKSNQLLAVTESAGIANTDFGLGDFTDNNRSLDDYDYDNNGNMLYDKNKGLGNITYNLLNLPQTITVTGKGTITYVYDAEGNKQQKIVQETNGTVAYNGTTYNNVAITTTTTYIGGIVYESKAYNNTQALLALEYTDRLRFITYEEGRIRFETANVNTCPATPDRLVYDFFIKDQLNNIRMVLTEQPENTCYIPATVEDAARIQETQIYDIKTTQEKLVSQVPGANAYPQFGQKFYRVSGSTAGEKTGLGMVLKVMSGDQVALSVQSYYNNTTPLPNPPSLAVSELLSALVTGPAVVAAKGPLLASAVSGIGVNNSSLGNFISNNTPVSGAPKAFLNWLLFDDQLRYLTGGSDPVGGGGYKLHDKFILGNQPVNVTQNGYLYIFVSNETTNIDVFFDNLTVTHLPGPLLEETQYYPFGLTMNGISSHAALRQENNYKYNAMEKQDKEFSNGIGLNSYDYRFRFYDYQTGRFWSVDRMADQYPHYAPYQFAGNEVPNAFDQDGLEPTYPHTIQNYMAATNEQINAVDAYYKYKTTENTFHMWNTMKFFSFFERNTTARHTPGVKTGNQFSTEYCKFDCITSVVTGLRILYGDYSLRMRSTFKEQSDYMTSKGLVSETFTFKFNTAPNSSGVPVPKGLDKDLGQELINSTKNEEGIHTFMATVGNGWHTFVINVDVTKVNNTYNYAFYTTDDENANKENGKRMTKDEFNTNLGNMILWFGTPPGLNVDSYSPRRYDNGDVIMYNGMILKLRIR